MPRNDRQAIEVSCTRCGKKFEKMQYGSGNISSFSFPVYKIQRYKDFDGSLPREINLCTDCSDKLDRFLYIYTEGQDYYRNEESNNMEEQSNE